MKRINGVMTPENFRECFGSWVLFTAEVTCGLCLRGKQRDQRPATTAESKRIAFESYFIDPEKFPVMQRWSVGRARAYKWRKYKSHIAKVHNGNWDLRQGFGR